MFNIPVPLIPTATKYNKLEFCLAWCSRYGGTIHNALSVYSVELLKNTKLNLSEPM